MAADSALLCAVPLASAVSGPTDADSTRIIGGSIVPEGTYPGTVYAVISRGGGCTASLIAPQWVLTARHCSQMTGNFKTVGYGSNDVGRQQKVRVAQNVNYPQGDVCLLQLEQPITSITPVKLTDGEPPQDVEMQVYGWGYTSEHGPQSRQLKMATMKYAKQARDDDKGPSLHLFAVDGASSQRPHVSSQAWDTSKVMLRRSSLSCHS